jgi:hypothetical protein
MPLYENMSPFSGQKKKKKKEQTNPEKPKFIEQVTKSNFKSKFFFFTMARSVVKT